MMCTHNCIQPPENLEEEQEQKDVDNPMMNPNILGQFFERIPFNCSSFKNFRLVCKSWLNSSQPRWRRNAWLTVKNRKCSGEPHISLKEIQKMLSMPGNPQQLLGEHPFRRYNVKLTAGIYLTNEFGRMNSSLEFWTKLGPYMTHLRIFETKIRSAENFKRVVLEMTPNLRFLSFENNWFLDPNWIPLPLTQYEWIGRLYPIWRDSYAPSASQVQKNLTTLELRLGNGLRGSNFPIAWIYFLARFPNIRTLKLREVSQWFRISTRGYEELKLFLNSILCIRDRCDPDLLANLQELDILHEKCLVRKFGDDDGIMLLLQRLRFPLQSLAVDIGSEQDVAGFRNILEPYSSSLQRLLAYRGPSRPPFEIEAYDDLFPFGVELHLLTELRLIGTIAKNLHFLGNLPSLRVLVLLDLAVQHEMNTELLHLYVDFWKDNLKDKVGPSETNYGTVHNVIAATNFFGEELSNRVLPKMEELIIGHENCTGDQLEWLGRLMPNLKKVRLGLDSCGFECACRNWQNLEHFDVDPFQVDEVGILGIVNCQLYHKPNITDLNYLKSFRVGTLPDGKRVAGKLLRAIIKGLQVTTGGKDLWLDSVKQKNWYRIK